MPSGQSSRPMRWLCVQAADRGHLVHLPHPTLQDMSVTLTIGEIQTGTVTFLACLTHFA